MRVIFLKKTERWFEKETVDLSEEEAKQAIEAGEAECFRPCTHSCKMGECVICLEKSTQKKPKK